MSRPVAVSAAVAVLALLGATTPAHAAGGPPAGLVSYRVVDVHTQPGDAVDFSRRVAQCRAGAGGTCSITRGVSVTTTVDVDLGATKGFVSGRLGFSLSRASSTSVTCTSRRLTAGQQYSAYPVGTRKTYRISKWVTVDTRGRTRHVGTSAPLTAFEPYDHPSAYCRVEPRS